MYKIGLTIMFFVLLSGLESKAQLTFSDLLEKAVSNNKTIQVYRHQLRQNQLDRRTAMLTYTPKITAEASFTHLNDDIAFPEDVQKLLMGTQKLLVKEALKMPFNMALPPKVPLKEASPLQEQNILKTSISAQLVLFSGLKVPYSMKAIKNKSEMIRLNTKQIKSTVCKELIMYYDKITVLRKSKEVLMASRKFLDIQRKKVEKARKNGLATELEVQQVELATQQLDAKEIELNSGIELVYEQIIRITGVDKKSIEEMNVEWQELPNTADAMNLDNRSDLKAIDKAIAATDYKRKIENSEYIPKIVAFGKKELMTDDLSLFDPEWYVGLGLRWTIFDGMKASNNAQKAKMDRKILETKKQNATELLTLKLHHSQLNMKKEEQLSKVAKQEEKTSKRAYELSEKQYANGLISLNEHLENLNKYEISQLKVLKLRYNYRMAKLDLYETAGILEQLLSEKYNLESL